MKTPPDLTNALGRKNCLFAGSDEGAKRSTMFYTFMGTCKLNNVNPMEWLNEVLNRIADHKVNKLYELFPPTEPEASGKNQRIRFF